MGTQCIILACLTVISILEVNCFAKIEQPTAGSGKHRGCYAKYFKVMLSFVVLRI
jgi:hypothetical protein